MKLGRHATTLFVTTAILSWAVSSFAADPTLVLYDQDTNGVIGVNADPLVMLIQSENVKVVGITVVTGDGWLKQETADVLKLLELMHKTDIPVYMGSEFPLVQSPADLVRDTQRYGGSRQDPWLGAYAETARPSDSVIPPAGGLANTQPQSGHAAQFIIDTIHKYPHQIVLYCGGPLTNIALAISLDPEIVPLTKEIVFMGTSPTALPRTVNVLLDPEAAHIVLRAPWPKLTLFTVDISERIHRSLEMAKIIAQGQNTPIGQLYQAEIVKPAEQGRPMTWFRMPDELQAAYIIDPTIITSSQRYYVDIDLSPGPSRGTSVYWDEIPRAYNGSSWPEAKVPGMQNALPQPGARIADVPLDFDLKKFETLYLALMTKPIPENN